MVRRTAEDAPELTEAELAEMRPARDVHSAAEYAALTTARKRGRPVAISPKVRVTIRLDPETVARFRSSGAGWQTRVSSFLTYKVADVLTLAEPLSVVEKVARTRGGSRKTRRSDHESKLKA